MFPESDHGIFLAVVLFIIIVFMGR